MTDKKPGRRQALRAFGKPRLTSAQKLVAALSDESVHRVSEAEMELTRDPRDVAVELRRAEALRAAADELAAFREAGRRVN